MKLLDLFCGRFGWSKAFAAQGWECVGIDWLHPGEQHIPRGCEFIQADILGISSDWIKSQNFDFICASSPCEQFSKFGLKCFYPDPPYPEMGIRLFNHTRAICEGSGVPYVMENVRAAQQFVGRSAHKCGPFHLWGSGVPVLMPQGILKGAGHMSTNKVKRLKVNLPYSRKEQAAYLAVIPSELSAVVRDYAIAITHK